MDTGFSFMSLNQKSHSSHNPKSQIKSPKSRKLRRSVVCETNKLSLAARVVFVVLYRARIVDMRLVFVSNQTWSKPRDTRTTNNGRAETDYVPLF